MGLFDIFFGRDDSVVESTVTGAAIGAYLGDKLDERADRKHIIQLLEAQIAQRNYHHAIDNLLRLPSIDDIPGIYDNWFWMWEPPARCIKWHIAYLHRALVDQVFSEERSSLHRQWHEVRERALAVGIIPTVSMPRSISGDISGTPESLQRAMLNIMEAVIIRERENHINKKRATE